MKEIILSALILTLVGPAHADETAAFLKVGVGARALGMGGTASLNGVAMGFGVKFYSYSIDYAITPFGELGNVQRFSLGAKW